MRYGFEDVTIAYGTRRAVDDITLPISTGAVTAIVGGDGAGKTTLLRCLAGRLAPIRGEVHRAPPERTGVLTAGPPGYGDLTVAENLRFVAQVRRLNGQVARRRSAALLAATGLTDARNRLADQLSGGMRRKLGFALATLHEPDVLLLDEPTTGVDPVSRTDLWRLMTTAAGAGTAVVLTTTYLEEAERCAHVLALDAGREVAQGEPDRIIGDVRGQMFGSSTPGPHGHSWRRGTAWRIWAGSGLPPAGAEAIEPDLEDAVLAAMIARTPDGGITTTAARGSA